MSFPPRMAQVGPISCPFPLLSWRSLGSQTPTAASSVAGTGSHLTWMDLSFKALLETPRLTELGLHGTCSMAIRLFRACLLIKCPCVSERGLRGPQGAAKPPPLAATEITKKSPGKCITKIGSGRVHDERVGFRVFRSGKQLCLSQPCFHIH